MHIHPKQLSVNCKYTLLEPVSHHDADSGLESNASLYRRQRIYTKRPVDTRAPADIEKHADVPAVISEAFRVPTACESLFSDEPFERFIGIALVKVFIKSFGIMREGRWGEGLFEGTRAYARLASRLEQTAARVPDLKSFWGLLLKEMRVGISEQRSARDALFQLLSIPRLFHHAILYELTQQAPLIVEMARFWHDTAKRQSEAYAAAAKVAQADPGDVALRLPSETLDKAGAGDASHVSLAVPHHSGNDIRHGIREAAAQFLLASLGFDEETDALPNGVKALLSNGGNIAKGKTAGNRAYALTQEIRATYPQFALLGGCTEGFLLGDSHLTGVNAFWEGREFNAALSHIFGITVAHSVMDALDTWTLHRHVTRHEGSPMPFAFEVIQAGLSLYVQFRFSPYTTQLEFGAFWTALQTFIATDATIGGNGAKGFGRVAVEVLSFPPKIFHAGEAYQKYLLENTERLKAGLCDGTLCTDTQVFKP